MRLEVTEVAFQSLHLDLLQEEQGTLPLQAGRTGAHGSAVADDIPEFQKCCRKVEWSSRLVMLIQFTPNHLAISIQSRVHRFDMR